MSKLTCDMVKGCAHPVTYIDSSGFIYCTLHGEQRKSVIRCRKMSKAELTKLESGQPLTRYEVNGLDKS